MSGLDLSPAVLLQGVIIGIPYGLLAVGLVLIYKVSRFINFAQGAIGAFGGALVGTLVVSFGVPYWIAFASGIVVAAGIAAAVEATIVRRLDGQPRLLGVVVTLLLGQFLLGASFAVNTDAQLGSLYPQPSGFPSFTLAGLVISPPYAALLILSPIVVVGLLVLLRRTSFGLAIRATASNPDTAYALGISPTKIAGRTWALAGGIAAFAAILLWPTQGFGALVILGPSLMLRGLVAAAIARFESVGAAFVVGVLIGVLDTVVRTGDATSGAVDVILTVVALAVLLIWPPRSGRESTDDGNWTALSIPPVPAAFREFWFGRNFGYVMGGITLLGAALWLPRYLDSASSFSMTTTLAFGIVGLSVLILTGRAGQLSLGQFALAGVGALASVKAVNATGVFFVGPVAAMAAALVVSVILGLPSLRSRGLVVAITTLAFALATRSWLLPQDWALGSGVPALQPVIGTLRFDDAKLYYYLALAFTVVAILLTWVVLRGRLGRDLVAMRDNENAARALGVPVRRRKLQAFAVSGALAGLGGSLLAHSQQLLTPETFPATASIDVVVAAVVGSLALISGPLVGAVLVIGLPLLLGLNATAAAVLQFVFLVLVIARSGGVMSILVPIRDWWVEEYVRLRGIDPRAVEAQAHELPHKAPFAAGMALADPEAPVSPAALELLGLTRSYGGIRAVRGVSLQVAPGEAVALIGPNGAGKTTLFEIAAGFVRPDEGQVLLDGRDVTRRSPEARARLGLVRSFQNALLFPTMTVAETLKVAHHRGSGGLAPEEVLDRFGLHDYADATLGTLPTGVRRVVELASDLVLSPRLLLLDEPSAGVAHQEIHALGALLRQVNTELGVTLVVIDHDMTLLRSVCSRFVALDLGEVIATGTADEVQAHPRVIEAFLGTTGAAERSRDLTAVAPGPTEA
jgi:ABC-type branched-subunit amino acid transport system ATPase component/ABC-type branched-subunit amino acid transport system permease subunit